MILPYLFHIFHGVSTSVLQQSQKRLKLCGAYYHFPLFSIIDRRRKNAELFSLLQINYLSFIYYSKHLLSGVILSV